METAIIAEPYLLSYSPRIIEVKDRQYILNYPLHCSLEKEKDYFVIKNEFLDLIGTGESRDEAKCNFDEEFDCLYPKLNSLTNDKITRRLNLVKSLMNQFVKETIEANGH